MSNLEQDPHSLRATPHLRIPTERLREIQDAIQVLRDQGHSDDEILAEATEGFRKAIDIKIVYCPRTNE